MRNENRVCYSKNLNENLYLVPVPGTVPWYALRKEPLSLPPLSFSFRKDLQKNSFIFLLVVVIFCAEVAKEKTSEE